MSGIRSGLVVLWLTACNGEDPTLVGPPPITDGTTDTGTTVVPPLPAVVINEVMPGNQSTLNGPGSDFPDWVELVNTGIEEIDLSTLTLRNGDGETWSPEGVLAPESRVLLTLDTFALDKDGDRLTLQFDGHLVDTVNWDNTQTDISLSRMPDTTGEFLATARPTPDAVNDDVPSATLNTADETVFRSDIVHEIRFTMSTNALQRLSDWSRPEVHVTASIDGVTLPDIGLKLKGSASYNDMNGKPAFIVDFNEWVEGTKFRDLKAIKLHNGNVYDPTRTHDHLSYGLARASGLMAPRVGFAQVFCNDRDFGIYMVIEKHDDVLIEYHDPSQKEVGVMLEPNEGFGDFAGWGNFSDSSIINSWEVGPVPPDPNVLAALYAVDDVLSRQANDANVALFFTHVNEERFLNYLAWETLVMHTDGYRAPNNWRVFVDGTTYQVQWVPAGAEWTWDATVVTYPGWGGSAWGWCLSNTGCARSYSEKVLEMADRVEDMDLMGDFRTVSTLLDPYIQSDPRYNPWWGSVSSARQSTIEHLTENPDRARSEVQSRFPDLVP